MIYNNFIRIFTKDPHYSSKYVHKIRVYEIHINGIKKVNCDNKLLSLKWYQYNEVPVQVTDNQIISKLLIIQDSKESKLV